MVERLESAVELLYSDEILFDEKGCWDKKVHEAILEEASYLEDEQKVRISYATENEKYGVVKETKAKTLEEIRENYFFIYSKDYVSKSNSQKVLQNI